jgi:hypothetical protein
LAAVLTLLLVVVAPVATRASNLGYWIRVTLTATGPTSGFYWISLPYLYTPPDTNSNLLLDAEDLVQDLQPQELARPCTEASASCAIARVWRWDPATGEYSSWAGGSTTGTPFQLVPGTAYGLELRSVGGQTTHDLDLLGIHDPALALSDCHTPDGINMRWISLPPNLNIATGLGISGVLDAEDLGQAMGGPTKIFQIRRLNETTGLWEGWVVGSVYGTPFEIDLSRAYAIDLSCSDLQAPCASCQWSWVPPHY